MDCPGCKKSLDPDKRVCPDCGWSADEADTQWEEDTATVDYDKGRPVTRAPSMIGKYRIQKELGKGAMGRVYLAEDSTLKRKVAVKTMIAGEDASEDAIARFMSEAKAAGKLRHSGIVSVHEVGQNRSLHFMVMDYIEGTTLRCLLLKGGLSGRRIAEIIRDTARALDYAHAQGVIHRDIKPANIMISDDGAIHLMDFGLARNLDADSSLTKSGDIMGSPAYLNPEQAGGQANKVDGRSDIYTLGAVMYEMLTGQTPAQGDNLMEIIGKVLNRDPVRPGRINARVDRDLEIICLKALFKEPERRYSTAAAMADDLQRFLDSEPIKARPASVLYHLSKKLRKHKGVSIVVLLILLAAGISVWVMWKRQRAAVEELAQSRKAEQGQWIVMYEQTFDNITELDDKWDTAMAGEIRDKALFIDGRAGGTVVWLNIPIIGKDWRFEYEGWPAPGVDRLNDIGLFVKADREGVQWKTGFEVQFGGRTNQVSGIVHKGDDIYTTTRARTIQSGHRYAFVITYESGVLSYRAEDTTTGEIMIDKQAEVPDINITRENQQQGFWTWESQIYIDNIRISKLGVPERRTYIDVARDFLEVVGAKPAIDYLVKELDQRKSDEEKRECFNAIVKFTLNATAEDKEALGADVVNLYYLTFPSRELDEVLAEDLIKGFYELCVLAGEDLNEAAARQLKLDGAFRTFTETYEEARMTRIIRAAGEIAEAGEPLAAIRSLDEVIEAARKGHSILAARALLQRAKIQEARGNSAEARAALMRVVAEYPAHPMENCLALLNLAELYENQGAPETALQTLELLMKNFKEQKSHCAHALFITANIYRRQGEHAKAIDTYLHVPAWFPNVHQLTGRSLAAAARLYGIMGEDDKARATWQQIVTDFKQAEVYRHIALYIVGHIDAEKFQASMGPKAERHFLFYRAEKARLAGDSKEALKLFEEFKATIEAPTQELAGETQFWIKKLKPSAE